MPERLFKRYQHRKYFKKILFFYRDSSATMAEPPMPPLQGCSQQDHGSPHLDTRRDHLVVAELLTGPLFQNASTPTAAVGINFPREFPKREQAATMMEQPHGGAIGRTRDCCSQKRVMTINLYDPAEEETQQILLWQKH